MASSQSISVLLIGVEQKEHNLLKGICQLSQSRPREYSILENSRSDFENYLYADIVIVDKENLHSIQQWKEFAAKSGKDFSTNVVFLTQRKQPDARYPEIQKPLIALRVLNTFDSLNITHKNNDAETAIDTASSKTTTTSSSSVYPGQKILVVDDSLPVRKHIEFELEKFHCQIDFSETAEQGLEYVQSKEYDLIFLDVVLPGMDGYELCKHIKRNKETRSTPVVMLTSKSSPFDRVRGSLAGCDNYLVKPVNAKDFNKVVERYLQSEQALEA